MKKRILVWIFRKFFAPKIEVFWGMSPITGNHWAKISILGVYISEVEGEFDSARGITITDVAEIRRAKRGREC